jgi:hypothetical protein
MRPKDLIQVLLLIPGISGCSYAVIPRCHFHSSMPSMSLRPSLTPPPLQASPYGRVISS